MFAPGTNAAASDRKPDGAELGSLLFSQAKRDFYYSIRGENVQPKQILPISNNGIFYAAPRPPAISADCVFCT
jgi:hypothetical protein